MTKAELRKLYLEKQKALSPVERASLSARIADRFFEEISLENIGTLHCFIPIAKFNEIDTMLIFERLWSDFPDIQTVVPRVEQNGMRSLKFARETDLVKNTWDIHEPAHHETVEPAEIDMVLAPLLAYDKRGHRVGYGKGFYDGFLAQCRPDCLKIGLSYFEAVDAIEDIYHGDIVLDRGVSPGSVTSFVASRKETTK
jgi:5-formyltetrahydrofolate cyclo-ligase